MSSVLGIKLQLPLRFSIAFQDHIIGWLHHLYYISARRETVCSSNLNEFAQTGYVILGWDQLKKSTVKCIYILDTCYKF